MKEQAVAEILMSAINSFRATEGLQPVSIESCDLSKPLSDFGLDVLSFSELALDLEQRFGGRDLGLGAFMVPEAFVNTTMNDLVTRIRNRMAPRAAQDAPIVAYVDDEEENLFVFKRKFGKDLNICTFKDPIEALKFIGENPDVGLVVTDEVMPGMRGNELCDEVRKVKPYMKFILITGNPEHDDHLMYKSLRQNRFYEFIQKPVDFDGRKDAYLKMIRDILEGNVS